MYRYFPWLLLITCAPGCALLAFFGQFAPENKYKMPEVYATTNYTSYSVHPNRFTKSGIRVDTSGFDIDLQKVDSLVNDFEKCHGSSIERRAVVIKIAPDWRWSSEAQRQIFPCRIGKSICGKDVCDCMGILQYAGTVVATPDLSALKHELGHLVNRDYKESAEVFRCQ